MRNYTRNLVLWWTGWQRFNEIGFKAGWSAESWQWRALYATDYLACPLFLAGPVISVSGFCAEFWGFTGYHFVHAGPALWGSVRSPPYLRVLVPGAWLLLLWWAL